MRNLLVISGTIAVLLAQTAWARTGSLQVQTDFTEQFASDPLLTGQKRLSRDLGLSSRWRLSILLMSRKQRELELLLGPYFRWPLVFSLTEYGKDIQAPSSYEIGGDLGISWFGYARTLFTFAPSWTLKYSTTDFWAKTSNAGRIDEITFNHFSLGLRIEVPIFVLESDPGDRRVEFGALFSYQTDKVQSESISALNYSPSSSDPLQYNSEIKSKYSTGHRWLLGAFMNFRL